MRSASSSNRTVLRWRPSSRDAAGYRWRRGAQSVTLPHAQRVRASCTACGRRRRLGTGSGGVVGWLRMLRAHEQRQFTVAEACAKESPLRAVESGIDGCGNGQSVKSAWWVERSAGQSNRRYEKTPRAPSNTPFATHSTLTRRVRCCCCLVFLLDWICCCVTLFREGSVWCGHLRKERW